MTGEHVQSAILAVAHPSDDPGTTTSHDRLVRVLIGLLGGLAIVWLELICPPTLSLGCLYMLLAVYTALRMTELQGALTLLAVGMAGILIKHWQLTAAGDTNWGVVGVEAWNGTTRIVTICIFGLVLRRLVQALGRERTRADRDPLTGALNRRALLDRLPAFAAAAARGGRTIGIAYVDLDGFKSVNDRFGHAAGDALLCRLACSAAVAVGGRDLFARIGGDEFIAVLSGVDGAAVEARAGALQVGLAAALDDLELGISCSMGAIVTEATAALELEPLIARADRLMYQVKRGGKDALRVAHYLPHEVEPDRPGLTVTLGGRIDRVERRMPLAAVG